MARKSSKALIAPPPPPMPPPTERELAQQREITAGLQALTRRLRQRNLDNAVLLARQAARGHGPLVDHFQELGRRFGDTLNEPQKPALRVVKGGAV